MWQPARSLANQPADVADFIELINAQPGFFASDADLATAAPVWIGRAPGRLDLMGGIADYSGSLVLEMPLAVATLVAAQSQTEPVLEVFNTGLSKLARASLPLGPILAARGDAASPDYPAVRQLLQSDPAHHWLIYPLGVLLVLQQQYQLPLDRGVRLFIHSSVPVAKGVSSSAALEVATLQALCGVYGLSLSGPQMARLAQQAENLVVGAPCGIMDQMTVACGQAGQLLALLCQPAELEPSLELPAGLTVWGLDSGIRHAVSGADYGSVRVGAFMGYRLVAQHAGLTQTAQVDETHVKIEDPLWGGYVANFSPSEWETRYCQIVPQCLSGAAFLASYGGLTDPITTIDPTRIYNIRYPTAHPIYENHRVQLFRQLLQSPSGSEETRFKLLGELMYQSHASYSRCGLGSDGPDRLVELVREAGPAAGLYGAKITGGGSGGMVAVLGRPQAGPVLENILARYQQETNRQSLILSGSSPGAAAWGGLHLTA